jgi:hypothetical protein
MFLLLHLMLKLPLEKNVGKPSVCLVLGVVPEV